MAQNVADFVIAWGVRRLDGYPDDGINGFTSALRRAGDRFEFVQARHEETAALMACAHAKFGGGLGVCLVTSGPGAIHALNGLYDARLDHQPVLAITGQQPRSVLATLAERLGGGEVDDLAAQLSDELRQALERAKTRKAERMSLDDFVHRVAEREGVSPEQAREHVRAVFQTLREAVTGDEWADMTADLPDEYRPLLTRS
jgi:pyruvate dehydrogenase (quinone)